jgi:hypothetical protein
MNKEQQRELGAGRKRGSKAQDILDNYQLDPKAFINWSELSTSLTGNPRAITSKAVPHCYVPEVAQALNAIIDWYEKVLRDREKNKES